MTLDLRWEEATGDAPRGGRSEPHDNLQNEVCHTRSGGGGFEGVWTQPLGGGGTVHSLKSRGWDSHVW